MGVHQLPWQHTSPSSAAFSMPVPRALFITQLLMGVAAVPCGFILIVNGMWTPEDAFAHSPFESFLVPGILLSGVVGGSLLIAAWELRIGAPHASIASLIAGAILLGWISIESVMVHDGRPLQAFVLITSLVIIGWRGDSIGKAETRRTKHGHRDRTQCHRQARA